MKKKLNILCVIVMLVLAYPVVEMAYYLGIGFNAGWEAVSFVEESEDKYNSLQKMQDIACMKHVYLTPKAFSPERMMNESVVNAKTGKKVPAMYNSLMVSVDVKGESPMFHNFIMTMINLLNLGMCIWAIALFVKLILAINKFDIFSWKNVRRLHRLGLALIAISHVPFS